MAYNLFRNWWYLSANLTAAELSIEPAIARLGGRYRSQMLFPGLRHIADFALLDRKIILEVDGKSHEQPLQQVKDILHTLALEGLGWKVVRCTNEVAMGAPDEVVRNLDALANHRPTPEELRAKLQALDPDGVLRQPKKTKRRQAPRPRASRKKAARKAKDK